jgi:hypothetical protein
MAMRRKTLWLALGLILFFLGSAAIVAYVLAKHQPSFYKAAAVPAGSARTAQSREFVSRYLNLMNSISNGYPDWWEVFAADQINSFLQEDFLHSWGGDNNLPDGFHDLRVEVEDNKLRLGCRYGTGFWSSVLSIEVKMWLVANEVNLVGVEILNLRAGAIPLSRQVILDYITEAARRSNIDCTWYHRNGNPVAVLKLQADQVRPTIQIQRFELQRGKIIIVGRSTEPFANHTVSKAPSR